MKCPKCGKEIAEDSTFCSYCGRRINKPMQVKVWLKKSTILWIILGSVLYGILIGGIISYKILLKKSDAIEPKVDVFEPVFYLHEDTAQDKAEKEKAEVEAKAKEAEASKAKADKAKADADRKKAEADAAAKAKADAAKAKAEVEKAKAKEAEKAITY